MRLGQWDQGGVNDAPARQTVEARGAEATYGDFGRYWFQPEYASKAGIFAGVLADAARLYAEGKVKPHIAVVVPFEAKALQEALDATGKGKLSTGKAVVEVKQ